MQESYYGRFLPDLLGALLEVVEEFSHRGREGEGILLVKEVPFADRTVGRAEAGDDRIDGS